MNLSQARQIEGFLREKVLHKQTMNQNWPSAGPQKLLTYSEASEQRTENMFILFFAHETSIL